jgi:hypothetical protein
MTSVIDCIVTIFIIVARYIIFNKEKNSRTTPVHKAHPILLNHHLTVHSTQCNLPYQLPRSTLGLTPSTNFFTLSPTLYLPALPHQRRPLT